jgi:DNA-binding beta-propeller fold protein YncE
MTGQCIAVYGSYGLGIDGNGAIWNSMYFTGEIMKINPSGTLASGFPKTSWGAGNDRGVAVTFVDNHVWVANSGGDNVSRLDNNGDYVDLITVGTTPTGVAVDANGKVWATNMGSDNVSRIDPNGGGPGVATVDMTVGLGSGAGPYNYSDMTGTVAIGTTSPQGTWTVVQDGSDPATIWGTITWNTEPEGAEPAGTSITVEARASDTQAGLSGETFIPVTNGVLFDLTGRFIEIRTTLIAATDGTSPVLSDLTVEKGVIEVDIDIKPGSDPNSINCENDKEVITVAILTTEDFDATTVDHTTVLFEGASETHVDKKAGVARRHEEDVDGDGDVDLVFHFRNGDTAIDCGATEATLTGETFEGRAITGTDAVRTVPANQ